MKTLVVTADDAGASRETNLAIARAAVDGIVTQASLLAGFPGEAHAIDELGDTIPLGVHLNLTEGSAATGRVAGATDGDGRFLGVSRVLSAALLGRLDLDAAEAELEAQLARAVAAGLRPAHLDGHHHVHVFPGLFDRVCRLAVRHRIPAVRVPHEGGLLPHPGARGKRILLSRLSRTARRTALAHGLAVTDHFRGLSLFDVVSGHHSRLRALLEALPDGTTELMVHPRPGPAGEVEVGSLTDPETRAGLDRNRVRLATFGTL